MLSNLDRVEIVLAEALTDLPVINVVLFIGDGEKISRQVMKLKLPTEYDSIILSNYNNSLLNNIPRETGSAKSLKSYVGYFKRKMLNQMDKHLLPTALGDGNRLFDTRAIDPNDVSRLLILILPACLKLKQTLKDINFIFRPMKPQFLAIVRMLGIEPVMSMRAFSGNVISFNVARRLAQFNIFDTGIFDINHSPPLSLISNIYDDFKIKKTSGYDRIFLAQKGVQKLINETEISIFLEGYGYKTVFIEDYPVEQQLSILTSTQHVIAVHGALMGFLALNSALKSVIEILPNNVHHEFFPIAIGKGVKKYYQIVPEFDLRVACIGWSEIYQFKNTPFHLSVNMLETVLNEIGN